MKKPIIAAIAALALCIGMIAGCSGNSQSTSASTASGSPSASVSSASSAQGGADGKVSVVCATFPAYDWVRQVVGDQDGRFEVTYLMGSGTDLHSYQPTVEDIAKIADADLFVYVGGESDDWAADAVEAAANPALHTVNMLEAIGDAAVEEEIVEGMQAEEEEEHAEEGAEEGPEYDEHVWLSLRNAQKLVDAIAGELSAIDAQGASAYAANAEAYKAELAALDARYADAVKAGAKNAVVFADRFPFRYLADDYNLKYYAAFVGCSAETEASFETVAFLAKKVDELGLNAVLVIEKSDQSIARTVVATTQAKDQEILVMDSLQSATQAEADGGKTYLGAMEDNLTVLTAALA